MLALPRRPANQRLMCDSTSEVIDQADGSQIAKSGVMSGCVETAYTQVFE